MSLPVCILLPDATTSALLSHLVLLSAESGLIILENNGLTGTIPTEIGNLGPRLRLGLALQANKMTGSIPTEVGRLTNLSK